MRDTISIAEWDRLRKPHGFFTGSLTPDELDIFERAIKSNIARRVYQGGAGVMGLSKVDVYGTPK